MFVPVAGTVSNEPWIQAPRDDVVRENADGIDHKESRMNRITRRSFLSGAVVVPVAAIGMRGVMAGNQSSTPEASPGASPEASPGASPMASPAAGGSEFNIVAEDIKFDVTEIRIPADTDVTVSLTNDGMLEHDWVVDGLDEVMIDILQSGETGSVTFSAEAGEYEFYCSVPGHREAGMVGTLIAE
jgi:plastocyanin